MAEISKLKPGQVVWSVSKHRIGNTMVKTTAIHSVSITEVDPQGKFVVASWNHNPAKKFYPSQVKPWRINRPITVESCPGARRLAHRDEIAAMKSGGAK